MAENPIQMFTNRLNLNRARGTRNQERELVGVEWDHEQCLSSGWEKDIKINRVQIENNFGFDFLLYDDGRNEHRDKQRQRQAATGQR